MSEPNAVAQAGGEEEIDEIMKEIRSLQDSISKTPTPTPVAVENPGLHLVPQPENEMSDFHSGGGQTPSEEPSLEETMAQMKADPEVKTLLDEEQSHPEEKNEPAEEEPVSDEELAEVIDQIAEDAKTQDFQEGDEGSLSMTLTGKMSLNLKYAFGEHQVKLRFHDQHLVVELNDGMELKIPLRGKTGSKAA
jgi:hypothetical protein